MKRTTLALLTLPALLGLGIGASGASGQPARPTPPKTAAQVIHDLIVRTEKELTGLAAEMPDDKYEFTPTAGAFRGVRSFATQVKHAAAVHHLIAASILGEPITSDMADERGPDAVRTKAEILQYLKDSFVHLKNAAATVNARNAFAPMKAGSEPETRMGLLVVALTHSSNHYGQIVEYLRMNGIVPPTSQ